MSMTWSFLHLVAPSIQQKFYCQLIMFFSLSHRNTSEKLREHLCLPNLAKGMFSLLLAEDSKRHIHLRFQFHISKGQIFVGKAFFKEFGEKTIIFVDLFAPCSTEIPLLYLGSVGLRNRLHDYTIEE